MSLEQIIINNMHDSFLLDDEDFIKDFLTCVFLGYCEEERDLFLYTAAALDFYNDETRLEFSEVYNKIKEMRDRITIPIIDVEVDFEDVVEDWVEYNTLGIVYGKVIGKKSYQFMPPLAPVIILTNGDFVKIMRIRVPAFEVVVDILSFKLPGGRTVRRFWEWRGRIEIYYTARLRNGRIHREKIGELIVDRLGHKALNKYAGRIVRRLKKIRRELMEKRIWVSGTEKAKLTREIKKVEEKIEYYNKLKQRHYTVGLRVWGWIGDEKVQQEVLAPVAIKRDRLVWGNQELLVMKKNEVDSFTVKHETIVEKKYTFFGRRGKLNHQLSITSIPKRKLEVASWVQTKPEYYKRRLEIRKHPVIVKEIEADYKVWVIEPLDSVSRVILHSKDHGREGLDRILIHLDNRVAVFIHKL